MSEVFYDAHPSLVRMRPLSVAIAILAVLFGIVVAVAGGKMFGLESNGKFVQIGGLLVAAVAFVMLLSWWITSRIDHLVIKDDELVWTHGLMNKQYTEIAMTSVRTVRVEQGLLDRILNVGKVSIFTSGDVPELVVSGLPSPDSIREYVKSQSNDEEEQA